MDKKPIPIKLLVVGDGTVGKTQLLLSYIYDTFPTKYIPTVFDNYAATVKIDGQMVNLCLWDTAGQEEYNRLRPLAYPHCDIILLVFSVIDPYSFVNARKKWYPELQENAGNVPIIFVGNYIHLRDKYIQMSSSPKDAPITKEYADKRIEEQFNCKYMECSHVTKQGVNAIFDEAVRIVLLKKMPIVKKVEEDCSCNIM